MYGSYVSSQGMGRMANIAYLSNCDKTLRSDSENVTLSNSKCQSPKYSGRGKSVMSEWVSEDLSFRNTFTISHKQCQSNPQRLTRSGQNVRKLLSDFDIGLYLKNGSCELLTFGQKQRTNKTITSWQWRADVIRQKLGLAALSSTRCFSWKPRQDCYY